MYETEGPLKFYGSGRLAARFTLSVSTSRSALSSPIARTTLRRREFLGPRAQPARPIRESDPIARPDVSAEHTNVDC